jgi:teichuronic acid biosynthesis glycosyltransferase TuaG
MSELKVDVIIPVYNGAAFIREAIISVQAQTFKNVNIIVVDDGSEDETLNILAELGENDAKIQTIKQAHKGVSFALNNGISNTTSPYIAFLDSDDLWHPEKLEKQSQILIDSGAEICFCLVQEFQDNSTLIGLKTHRARTAPLKGYNKTAFMGRREVFNKYGLFYESAAVGDFVEWFSRVIRTQHNTKMIDEVLAYRRVHTKNTMLNADKNTFLHILKKHLDASRKTDN